MSQSSMPALQGELQERLAEVANRAKNFTSAGGAAIALASGDQFVTCVTAGTSLEVGAVIPIPTSFPGFRREKGNVLRCGDTDKEATIDLQACRAARIKSILVVPVGELSSIRGVLAVFASAANAFTETHVAVLKTLAEVVSHLLPAKEKTSERLPEKEKKSDELLEHPFNPAFDTLPKAVKVGASEQPEVSKGSELVPLAAPIVSPSPPVASSRKETSSIFAGSPPVPAARPTSKPAPEKPFFREKPTKSVPPRVSSHSPATASRSGTLNLASDPLSHSLVSKPTRRVRWPVQSSSAPVSRKKGAFNTYAVVIAIVAAVGLGLGLYTYVSNRNVERSAVSQMIPPQAPRVESPAIVPAGPAPAPASHEIAAPIKTDVVATATAADLPDNKIVVPKSDRKTAPPAAHASDTSLLQGNEIVVVTRPASAPPPGIPEPEQESPPNVSVPANTGVISDVLRGSAMAPAPVLKRSQVSPAVLVSKVAPIYPEDAKRYRLQGIVVISAKVTKTGTVSDVRTVSGNAILGDAGINAVKKWRYKPATSDGRPVESQVEVTFDFKPPR